MKFGICSEIFKGWRWEDAVDFAGRAGYAGVEIAPFMLAGSADRIAASRRREIAEQARRADVEIIGLHWLLASPGGLSLTSPDESTRRRTSSYMSGLVRLCSDLGGRLMVLGSPEQRRVPPGSSYQEAARRFIDALAVPLHEAEKAGVLILLEPLSPSETNFLNTAEEAAGFIERAGHPNLRLNLDVKAMASENKPPADIIRESRKYLAHLHANDPNLRGPGSGEFDFKPVRDALDEIGYEGYLSVEVFDFSQGPEEIAVQSLSCLKEIFGKKRSQ